MEEHAFLKANRQLRLVLQDIRILQTEEEAAANINLVVQHTHAGVHIPASQVVNSIKTHLPEGAEKDVTEFVENAQIGGSYLPLKSRALVNFISEVHGSSVPDFQESNRLAQEHRYTPLKELPQCGELINKSVDNLDLNSHTLSSVDVLVAYSEVNPMLTCLANNQLLIQLVGVHFFIISYRCFLIDDSFRFFVLSIRDSVAWKLTPVYQSIKVSFQFIGKHKVQFLGATATSAVFAGFMYNWFGIKPPVETLKVKNIQVFIPKVSEYAPKDGSEAKEVFDGVKSVTGQISYMFTNIFSHITMGGRAGVLDATVGPELRGDSGKKH
jgi:hypothetical protein